MDVPGVVFSQITKGEFHDDFISCTSDD